jgi:predicted phosphodiesterase
MYRAAILTDVHGNLPALKAVLDDVQRAGVDAIYHLGDVIAIGPFPREALELLLDQPNTHFILGNHDEYFAFGIPNTIAEDVQRHERWVQAELPEELRPIVRRWPRKLSLKVGNIEAKLLHYALADDEWSFKPIIKEPTPDQFGDLFASAHANLVFYGHHHPQSDVSANGIRYINPGALGCSHDNLARYVMLSVDNHGNHQIEFKASEYDRQVVMRAFDEREVPVREFIKRTFYGVVD